MGDVVCLGDVVCIGDVARGNVKADNDVVSVGVLREVVTPPVGGVFLVVCGGNVQARENVAFCCESAAVPGAELVFVGARADAAAVLAASGGALVTAVGLGASCCGLAVCVVLGDSGAVFPPSLWLGVLTGTRGSITVEF